MGTVAEADGWLQEDAKDFLNVALGLDGFGSGLPLTLWSRHFASGSSYSIETKDLMIGGVISECSDVWDSVSSRFHLVLNFQRFIKC